MHSVGGAFDCIGTSPSRPKRANLNQHERTNQVKKGKPNRKTNQPKKATATTAKKKNQSKRNQNQTPNQTNNHGLEETCPHFVNAFGSGLIVVLGGEEVWENRHGLKQKQLRFRFCWPREGARCLDWCLILQGFHLLL